MVERPHKYNFPEGEVLLIDKAAEWTSFDAVNKIRHMLRHYLGIRKIKVGHAGTLDPLASGLLLVCVGKATKQIPSYTGLDKEYTGTFHIGATTPSFDSETEVDKTFDISHITSSQLLETARSFIGTIMQTPPAFSAVKIGGTRAYHFAREKEKIDIPPRQVTIYEFEICDPSLPEPSFRVLCSKGTYIRTLADDFGRAMGAGAFLKSLRRTRIGDHSIEQAVTIPQLEKILQEMQNSQSGTEYATIQ